MSTDRLRIVSPNGHLGFGKTRPDSFRESLKHDLDYVVADAGSCDIGPGPLGSDTCASPREWQDHDLELMLLASRRLDIPMIIGSCGDTGSRAGVDLFVSLIKQIAARHNLPEFTIGYFYSDVAVDDLRRRMDDGLIIEGLDGRAALTPQLLDATDRVVAVAGADPYISLLDAGADVILGGRSSDCAIFAAPAIRAGFPTALSYYLGKVLECASFCAEPYGGKESVLGEITHEHVDVTAMSAEQRCTPNSVASHSMYERAHPFIEYVAGGMLDMAGCRYTQIGQKTTRVTGPQFVPAAEYKIKLEGSGFVGHRYIGFAGIRDGYTIANVDAVIEWARAQVREKFSGTPYELHFHVFGKDAILKQREPHPLPGHELGIVVDAVAADRAAAEEICMTATRQLFYARLPEVKGTAGGVSFLFDEVLRASDAYTWTINHLLPVDDLTTLFDTHVVSSRS